MIFKIISRRPFCCLTCLILSFKTVFPEANDTRKCWWYQLPWPLLSAQYYYYMVDETLKLCPGCQVLALPKIFSRSLPSKIVPFFTKSRTSWEVQKRSWFKFCISPGYFMNCFFELILVRENIWSSDLNISIIFDSLHVNQESGY